MTDLDQRDLLAELHEEQCAHGATLRKVDELRGLLARILASSEDGTIEIPDVAHAIEAEIKDALNPLAADEEEAK